MKLRTRYLLAAAFGLGLAHSSPAQEPGRLDFDRSLATPTPTGSANQRLANAVAATLRQGGQLRNYRIDVACVNGVVELNGLVANQVQHDETLRLVQGVPGVERVLDRLLLAEAPAILRTQAGQPDLSVPASETKEAKPPQATEPLPLVMGGPPNGGADLNPPRMPPYAWPSYAPYNNFSRVAYPTAYPNNAWPYIGPVHPFPKVPLGWRSVKLEFEDGYWWFSRVATKHDWWRLKYW